MTYVNVFKTEYEAVCLQILFITNEESYVLVLRNTFPTGFLRAHIILITCNEVSTNQLLSINSQG